MVTINTPRWSGLFEMMGGGVWIVRIVVTIAAASVVGVLSFSARAAPEDATRADLRPTARPQQVAPTDSRTAPRVDLSPSALSPSALPPVPDPDLGAEPPRAVKPPARDLRTGEPRSGAKKPAPPDDKDDELAARPGAFAPTPTKLPSTLHKERVVAPHTAAPDLGVDLSKRSSVGVFGEVGRINREDIRSSTVKEGRDVGAGVTWQYKFDSR